MLQRGIFVFFFQAEDGIRDLVRSRGLGDVYKRQITDIAKAVAPEAQFDIIGIRPGEKLHEQMISSEAVSYTHLTLPTSDLV